jgi:kinetochore protein Spc7/SPC105
MAYRREIEIVFDIAAFQEHQPNSTIDLWYIADSREQNALPKTTEKEFFLQSIRDYVRALPHSRTEVSRLLTSVQTAWDKANLVSSQVERLNATFPTTVERTSDSSVAITTSLLLVPLETRLEIKLDLQGQSSAEALDVVIAPEAKVLYGEHFNVPKVADFLMTRIGKAVGAGEEQWSDVMVELHGRLIARGRKAG